MLPISNILILILAGLCLFASIHHLTGYWVLGRKNRSRLAFSSLAFMAALSTIPWLLFLQAQDVSSFQFMTPFQVGGLSLGPPPGPADMSGHGVTGEVIAVDADGIVVRGQDNAERFVIAATGTSIVRQSKKIDLDELKIGDVINVIGRPDDLGRIEARLIRVMPGGFPISR